MPLAVTLPRSIPPSLTWILVFGPALAYLLTTRTSGLSATGEVVSNQVLLASSDVSICRQLSSIVSLVNHRCDTINSKNLQLELSYPLAIVQHHGFSYITNTLWRHDSEIGRGYLLVADAQSSSYGRIWRWETGGGPIAIGKTLHLDQAGCRSGAFRNCSDDALSTNYHQLGPGGMAIDFHDKEHFAEGRLVISEWGERRIVRLEENGARTPLVVDVPDICSNVTTTRRVERPSSLQYDASGHLFFIDHYDDCQQSALMIMKHAVHVPALASLAESRAAHYKWTHTWDMPEVMLTRTALGDVALAHDYQSLLVTAMQEGKATLLKVSLVNDSLEDEDEEDVAAWMAEPQIVLQLDEAQLDEPGYIAVDEKGHIYWAISDFIFIIDADFTIIGRLATGARIHSLTLGDDRFLYVAIRDSLLRLAVKIGPSKVPTDLVQKRLTSSTT